jgi:hypothetical protein
MRYRLLALTLVTSAFVTVASAEIESQSQPPTQDFATAKSQHVARLQQELTCVEAATTFDALRACMPKPPGGHMGPPPGQQR